MNVKALQLSSDTLDECLEVISKVASNYRVYDTPNTLGVAFKLLDDDVTIGDGDWLIMLPDDNGVAVLSDAEFHKKYYKIEPEERMLQDIRYALKENITPSPGVCKVLHQHFLIFPDDIQDAMIEKGWVKKQRCEVWSRVMGYFRPVDQWNKGKKQEHADRHHLTGAQGLPSFKD